MLTILKAILESSSDIIIKYKTPMCICVYPSLVNIQTKSLVWKCPFKGLQCGRCVPHWRRLAHKCSDLINGLIH